MDFTAHATTVDAGTVSARRLYGRTHLVAPVVLVREGLLNGGFLPAEEIEKSADAWNGVPVTADHPKDRGALVPLDTPELANEYTFGQIFDAQYEAETNSLTGTMWLDVDRARELGGHARETVRLLARHVDSVDGESMNDDPELLEVSTGYRFTQRFTAGSHDGQRYAVEQTNLVPDHLAALPHAEGKCSVEGGCGAPRTSANSTEFVANVLNQARTPEYSGTESSSWSKPTLDDYTSAYGIDASSVEDLSGDDRTRIANTSLLGEASAESFAELVFFPVVNPSTNSLNENALDAVISGRGEQADVPDDATESAQSRARSLLRDEFDRDLETNAAIASARTDGEQAPMQAHNQQPGDRVRWTDSEGEVAYGIVVDPLEDDDDDIVLVAVYDFDDDAGEWDNTQDTRRISRETLTDIEQLPASPAAANAAGDSADVDATVVSRAMSMLSAALGGDRAHTANCACDDCAHEQPDGADPAETDTDPIQSMTIDELADRTAFNEAELEELSDEQLQKLAESLASNDDENPSDEEDDRPDDDSPREEEPEPAADEEDDSPESDADDASGLTADDIRNIVREEVAANSNAGNRDEYKRIITMNTGDPGDLDDRSDEELRAMAEMAERMAGTGDRRSNAALGVNYAGRGVPDEQSREDPAEKWAGVTAMSANAAKEDN